MKEDMGFFDVIATIITGGIFLAGVSALPLFVLCIRFPESIGEPIGFLHRVEPCTCDKCGCFCKGTKK